MFKRFILIIFALILPFILLFTLYRASVGYGPLSFSSILSLIGSSFSGTSDRLQDVFHAFDDASNGLLLFSYVEPFSDGTANFFYNLFHNLANLLNGNHILACFMWLVRLFWLILKLCVAVVQDVSDVIRILGFFIVGSSPYEVLPYFPVS